MPIRQKMLQSDCSVVQSDFAMVSNGYKLTVTGSSICFDRDKCQNRVRPVFSSLLLVESSSFWRAAPILSRALPGLPLEATRETTSSQLFVTHTSSSRHENRQR